MPTPLKYNKRNKPFAQALRREMTKQERHLWYDYLCNCPLRFRRQKQFGDYIVDFYCARAKLVIELDGSQHFEPEGSAYDQERDQTLNRLGIQVLRIPNNEVKKNFRGVCEYIDGEIQKRIQA